MAWSNAGWSVKKWAFPALGVGALCAASAPPLGIDWPVLAMGALAASASGLKAELRGRGARVQIALVHPVLFGCAVTLGPMGALIPAGVVGVCRVLSNRQSHTALHRLLYDLLGPAAATMVSSLVYVWSGGSLSWPQGANSLAPLLWAAVVYASAGAIMFGAARKAAGDASEEPAGAAVVAAGWFLSLLAGYVLAIVYAAAPVYAFYAVSVAGICAAWALGAAPAQQREADRAGIHCAETQPHDSPSYVDSVTGLANRRYLDLFLDREFGRSQRLGKPLSIAVFNIDGYRRLDQDAGQRAMLELGECLTAGVREYDIAARHSDGRLVLVLPETTTEAALDVVDRLRRSASTVMVDGRPLSVSVGLAAFPEHGVTAEEIINAAHYALNRGRSEESDRVHLPENLAKAS